MSASKAIKTIALTATSQESHNLIKIKNVMKWLKTGHEVRVQINGKADRHKAIENLYKTIESDVKGGAKILQKVAKPESIRFNIRPTKDAANFIIDDEGSYEADNEDLSDIVANKDLFSEEFEKELDESIRSEKSKGKKK